MLLKIYLLISLLQFEIISFDVDYICFTVYTFKIMPSIILDSELLYWRLFSSLIVFQTFYNWFQCCRKYVNKALKVML